jgi:hypothetical protein
MTIGRRRLAFAAIVLGLIGVGWWLFGFSTLKRGASRMTLYRFFGRVTRIESVVAAANGKAFHERILFPWSQPFVNGDPITDCAAIFPEVWQDRGGHGRWDTWLKKVGPDSNGNCQVKYLVDTKGTGKPDWTFVMNYGDYKKADEAIKARRGF